MSGWTARADGGCYEQLDSPSVVVGEKLNKIPNSLALKGELRVDNSLTFLGTCVTPQLTGAMAAPASLVHPDALDEVFDIIDTNGDGVLTVNEFILVRTLAIARRSPERNERSKRNGL